MNFTIRKSESDVLCELGAGLSPIVHPRCQGGKDVSVDFEVKFTPDGKQTVDFACDLSQFPWPIGPEEFDGTISRFCLEHMSYLDVRGFLAEMFRITKPGGNILLVVPNTEAQLKWIQKNPTGWDGKPLFEAASEKLFGTQYEKTNNGPHVHKCFFNPDIMTRLVMDAGFVELKVAPYGERQTDMMVQAIRPGNGGPPSVGTVSVAPPGSVLTPAPQETGMKPGTFVIGGKRTGKPSSPPPGGTPIPGKPPSPPSALALPTPKAPVRPSPQPEPKGPNTAKLSKTERSALYGMKYFDFGGSPGIGGYADGYWDYPWHEVTARQILSRKPESVLELGCARGYVLKRIEDAGIPCLGMDVSHHAYHTRISDRIIWADACETPWPYPPDRTVGPDEHWGSFDLCFSLSFLEYIPEEKLPAVLAEMKRLCKRGLHGIDFNARWEDDKTRNITKPPEWWRNVFAAAGLTGHEIVDKADLERGGIPEDYLKGDGQLKLNIGCAWTMFHQGWINIDSLDLKGHAQQWGYNFVQADVKEGMAQYGTGTVDLIYTSHMLEHLSYSEGTTFLRECRRILKPDTGALRVIVPDAEALMGSMWAVDGNELLCRLADPDLLRDLGEINDGCKKAKTAAAKLYSVLHVGHAAIYDAETLKRSLEEAGFQTTCPSEFRVALNNRTGSHQILKETLDMLPCLSLYADAIPALA